MKIIVVILKICFAIYVLLAVLLYFFQRDILYVPSDKYDHPFGEILVKNQDVETSAIVLNPGNKDALIYFGGNGEPVIFNAERFRSSFPKTTIYLVNYRGYGGSTGKPTEQGLYSDSLAFYDRVKPKHETVSVVGRSLGSGVATYLSVNRVINKLILITPYDSILNVAKQKFFFLPVSFLLRDKYDSISRVNKIDSKTLVLAAENDQIIPISHSESLVNAFPSKQVKYKVIKNTVHNNISHQDEFYEYIRDFLIEYDGD